MDRDFCQKSIMFEVIIIIKYLIIPFFIVPTVYLLLFSLQLHVTFLNISVMS